VIGKPVRPQDYMGSFARLLDNGTYADQLQPLKKFESTLAYEEWCQSMERHIVALSRTTMAREPYRPLDDKRLPILSQSSQAED
jgi:hypothetical protein